MKKNKKVPDIVLDLELDKERLECLRIRREQKLEYLNNQKKKTSQILKCLNVILLDVFIVSIIVYFLELFIYGNDYLVLILSFIAIYFFSDIVIRCLVIELYYIRKEKWIWNSIPNIIKKINNKKE